jgi:uncharacterized FAD-dependent dehydrogenase
VPALLFAQQLFLHRYCITVESSPKLTIFFTYRKQREFERRAATMGGGNFVVPAQRVTDFISNRLSGTDIANTFEVASN